MGRTLAELGEEVERVSRVYADRFGIQRDNDWFALKLTEEVGELVAEYVRGSGRGRGSSEPNALEAEAADLLAHLLLFCRRNGVDLEAALQRKWLRYLPENETPDSVP